MKVIGRREAWEMIAHKAPSDLVIVDVMDPGSFARVHIRGAVNVPLDEQFDKRIRAAVPEGHLTVMLYGSDAECDRADQAAHRMIRLRYQNVYVYEPGRADWCAAGLPVEFLAE